MICFKQKGIEQISLLRSVCNQIPSSSFHFSFPMCLIISFLYLISSHVYLETPVFVLHAHQTINTARPIPLFGSPFELHSNDASNLAFNCQYHFRCQSRDLHVVPGHAMPRSRSALSIQSFFVFRVKLALPSISPQMNSLQNFPNLRLALIWPGLYANRLVQLFSLPVLSQITCTALSLLSG